MSTIFQNMFAKDLELPETKFRGAFDFFGRKSDRLLVTIGDSWTFGWRLGEEVKNDNENYRIQQCFGGLISNKLGWDFLNLSIPAVSNLWMANKYRQLANNFHLLSYDQISVIVVLTEYGREFWTDFDNKHPEIFEQYRYCTSAYDIAKTISKKVSELLTPHPKIDLITGINYVTDLYPSKFITLSDSWLEVLLGRSVTDYCQTVGSWVIPKYENLMEANPDIDRTVLIQELDIMTTRANDRLNLIYSTGYTHKGGYGHPISRGHELWAEHIMNSIEFK